MKIAVFSDSFFPGIGGTEKATYGLAESLVKLGNDVIVACPKFKGYEDKNLPFKVIRSRSLRLTANDYVALPWASSKLKKQIKNFKPDIIHCQSVSGMTSYAFSYAKKYKIPVIMTVHTKFKTAFENNIRSKFIVKRLLKDMVKKLNKANTVFTVSKDMANELASYGYKKNVKIAHNGSSFEIVNNGLYNKENARDKFGFDKKEFIFLFVGLIIKYKNIDFILNALKIVKETRNDFRFICVGEGPDLNYFQEYAKKIGLNDNVVFTYKITDRVLLESIYRVSDLYLFPSLFDNDSLTIIEAASQELPSLVIENSGSSERIVDGVSGFVCDFNVHHYAEEILKLMDDKSNLRKVGQIASKMIPKKWEDTAKEYLIEYKKLVNDIN